MLIKHIPQAQVPYGGVGKQPSATGYS